MPLVRNVQFQMQNPSVLLGGGVVGPKLLNPFKWQNCKKAYNGKTSKDNASNIAIYFLVTFVAISVLFAGNGFLLAFS